MRAMSPAVAALHITPDPRKRHLHMRTPRLKDEYERGYNALFLCISGAALLNTIGLFVGLYAVTQVGWPGWLSVGYSIGAYLVLYVLNVVGKAALIGRDLLIDQYHRTVIEAQGQPR
jgi:hypothetical protein